MCSWIFKNGEEQQRHLVYLEVVDHRDVSGRCFSDAVIYYSISFWSWDATGGQDLVVLVHAQRLPTQVFNRQSPTETQHYSIRFPSQQHNLICVMHLKYLFFLTHLSTIFLKSKTPAINLAANLWWKHC